MDMKRRYSTAAVFLAVSYCIVLIIDSFVSWAAEANSHFGSESYAKYTGETFNVGVYLESEAAFSEYYIMLSYDPAYVEYVSGALSGGEGTVLLGGIYEEGSGYVKTMLQFRALAVGDTFLAIKEVAAVDAEGVAFDIVNQGAVPLLIQEDVPVYLNGISIDGQPLEGFSANTLTYELQVPYETEALEVEALGRAAEISDTALEVGENTIDIRLTSPGGIRTVYTLYVTREEKIVETAETTGQSQTEGEAQAGEGEEGRAETGTETQTGEGAESGTGIQAGEAGRLEIETGSQTGEDERTEIGTGTQTEGNQNGEVQLAEAAQTTQADDAMQIEGGAPVGEMPVLGMEYEDISLGSLLTGMLKQRIVYIPTLVMVLIVAGISAVWTSREYSRELASEQIRKAEWEAGFGWKDPIIAIEDVSMDFKVAMQNVSGIKEWMIKKLRGRISYRTLHALSHISFFVYPGEVIGIIGTNGSGKSTLLKIVSGALTPTSGYVKVDRSKIQLLTLGTGFDMELTARENVYLNGSVIGYSREFIDEHYDDIVAFAELEGFMEEKVKNFSSGMVSRLGFAIATVGDAAEILILDEVLSVGDEFFRKKSLERIKEMIHGGSTVLMVSHGMSTIMENCTRAVWIEKGRLMMIGDVKRVCEAYGKMKG